MLICLIKWTAREMGAPPTTRDHSQKGQSPFIFTVADNFSIFWARNCKTKSLSDSNRFDPSLENIDHQQYNSQNYISILISSEKCCAQQVVVLDHPRYGSVKKAKRAEWDPISAGWSSISHKEKTLSWIKKKSMTDNNMFLRSNTFVDYDKLCSVLFNWLLKKTYENFNGKFNNKEISRSLMQNRFKSRQR